jgi:RNA polymerase sigma-70 factor, ECF subfamily
LGSSGDDELARRREAALVARAASGDMEAFDALITPLLPRAASLARRLMDHTQDAEDLVQEACLRAIDRIDQHDQQRAFAPWFFRVLVNLGLNAQRVRKVRRTEVLTDFEAADLATPDIEVEQSETRRRFAVAVQALPPRQRQIVMWHEVDGWTAPQIADALSLSQATVRWHLHEARRSLRKALGVLRDQDDTDAAREARAT